MVFRVDILDQNSDVLFIWALIMVVLIPWPYERIRQGNIYGHVTGRLLMWILGNPIKFEGLEYADEKATIFAIMHPQLIFSL